MGFGDCQVTDLHCGRIKLGYRAVDSKATKLDIVAVPLHFEIDGGSELNGTYY